LQALAESVTSLRKLGWMTLDWEGGHG